MKKHRYVERPGLIKFWPVYVEIPSAINDPAFAYRPLAIARGFLYHFVRGTQSKEHRAKRPWPREDDASIMGPNARINYEKPITVSLLHAPPNLFASDVQENGRTKFLYYSALNVKCSLGKIFRYERQEGHEFDQIFFG